MRPDLRLATAVLSALALAACADPQPAAPGGGGGGGPSTGAHQAHLTSGTFANAYTCNACHDPTNNAVAFPAASPARYNGASPVFDATAKTCSNVYCHAGGPQLPLPGGTVAVPAFQPPSTVACGACHGLPPPNPGHPVLGAGTSCGGCHEGYSLTSVNKAVHLNGVVNLGGSSNCTTCHGDASRLATTTNPQLPASPPSDTQGNAASTSPGVGAHQAHLNDGALRRAMACTECHAVPADVDHALQPLQLTWGPLARTGGASPSYSGTAFTCSATYCHGTTLGAGGTLTVPTWTSGASQVACGSCHAIPPPAPHPAVAPTDNCGACHPGYGVGSVNVDTHVNGTVDISGGLTCTTCHGDGARTATAANPQLPAAPPVGTGGETATTSRAVGAHQAHLTGTTYRQDPIACTECHVVPTSMSHPDGTRGLTWGPLATASGTTAPTFNGSSCSATYCHGATLNASGSQTAPGWTGGAPQATCGSCHALPSGSSTWHATVATNVDCGLCHVGYTRTSVNKATHISGTVQAKGTTCTSCHGDASRTVPAGVAANIRFAPPVDRNGNASGAAVGAHLAHLTGTRLRGAPIECTQCHALPGDLTHVGPAANTPATMTWGSLATTGGLVPSFAAGSCSATYCHGGSLPGGTTTAPAWTGTSAAIACNACHGNAPSTGDHGRHASLACSVCHGTGYTRTGATTGTVNATLHLNGVKNVGGSITSWNPTTRQCVGCHGSDTW
jgi:predicted CxxxxCH...CXXCH cytochrome family protein